MLVENTVDFKLERENRRGRIGMVRFAVIALGLEWDWRRNA